MWNGNAKHVERNLKGKKVSIIVQNAEKQNLRKEPNIATTCYIFITRILGRNDNINEKDIGKKERSCWNINTNGMVKSLEKVFYKGMEANVKYAIRTRN